jgi:hypothetical protein
MIVTTPLRAVPIAVDFPLRRSSRCVPAGYVMRTWSAIGSTTSCRAPCFQWAIAPPSGSEAMRSGAVFSTRAISMSAEGRSEAGTFSRIVP